MSDPVTLTKCVIPECTRTVEATGKVGQKVAGSRGCCHNHYASFLRLIRRGRTNWKELVKLGLATPIAKRGFDKGQGPAEKLIKQARLNGSKSSPPQDAVTGGPTDVRDPEG